MRDDIDEFLEKFIDEYWNWRNKGKDSDIAAAFALSFVRNEAVLKKLATEE